MSQLIIPLHPITPEERSVEIIAKEIRKGTVILYPTDTGMALGCALKNKQGIDRIRSLRKLQQSKSMTFLCEDISNIAEYAKISTPAYRIIKRLIPGPFTFILPATRLVPHFAHDDKRKTVGIRVPSAPIAHSILHALGEPLISITAKNPDEEEFDTIESAIDSLGHGVDVIVTMQKFSWLPEAEFERTQSTIIDMTTDDFTILREGQETERVLELIGEEA